jgi:S1-C subfamily serine protease
MMDFKMRMVFRAIVLLLCSFGAAQAQEVAWIQLEAHPDLATSEAAARLYAQTTSNIAGFRLGPKWYVLALGPYDPAEAAGQINALKASRIIPRDAYITDGKDHGQQFWPVGAAQLGTTQPSAEQTAETMPLPDTQAVTTSTTQTSPTADETPEEARQSEALLSRDERALMQTAMAWYGFYDAKIDGSFGKGTRQSMAAWQTALGFEPTGILTSLQRATLVGNYQADQAEFGFETMTEPEAGIEIALPNAMVSFDRYDPPFVHYTEINGSKLRLMLISEPGDQAALAGLYDVLQTLDAVPSSGDRTLEDGRFTINATNDKMAAFAYAITSKGSVKGYLATWDPAISAKMTRILPALQASFRAAGDKYLDPGLVSLDEAARTGLLAGMHVKRPTRTGSGIFVDKDGSVLTNSETVAECGKITLDNNTEASVIAVDQGVALLKPLTALQPTYFAPIATETPLQGGAVIVAGFSPFVSLPAAVLSRGTVAGATGLDGTANYITLALSSGDIGGPILDETGALLGMMTAAPKDKVLPEGISLALSSGVLAQILADNGIGGQTVQTVPLTTDALNAAAMGMTTQIACWP